MGFSRQEYWSGVPLPSPMVWPGKHNTLIGSGWLACFILVQEVESHLDLWTDSGEGIPK